MPFCEHGYSTYAILRKKIMYLCYFKNVDKVFMAWIKYLCYFEQVDSVSMLC